MTEVSIEKIEELAKGFAAKNLIWHFHFLTPKCKLNEGGRHAFFLENNSANQIFVCYSDSPYLELGKKLVPLLHKGVFDKGNGDEHETGSEMEKILKRADDLNQQGRFWHHHTLPPKCVFNDSGKWQIMFEDQENNEILRSFSDKEPIADLQKIESAFYRQKTLV